MLMLDTCYAYAESGIRVLQAYCFSLTLNKDSKRFSDGFEGVASLLGQKSRRNLTNSGVFSRTVARETTQQTPNIFWDATC